MTLSGPIATARTVLNDAGVVTYTQEDLLRYANDALDALMAMAPAYFYERGTVACVAGEVSQSMSFASAHAIVSVDGVQGGNAVLRADKALMDRFKPAWRSDTAAAAVNWMPHADSAVKFYIYPKAPSNQVLDVTYIKPPGEYTTDQDTGLPVTLAPAIADYIVGMAMSRDDEHVNNNRAQAFMASFSARIKGA